MSDLTDPEIQVWQDLESSARSLLARYAFHEIRTPVLEYAAVFERSLGDTTDVVQKEMYTFEDRGKRRITLRPEGTAGVMRHVASMGQEAQDARFYYIGPMFRSERPQAGRRRQFHQLGAEAIGAACAAADVEMLAMQWHLLTEWGLKDCRIEINTRGLPTDHDRVADGLRAALDPVKDRLCEDCLRRYASNPLRILDCKRPSCKALVVDLPPVSSLMSEEARAYLATVCAGLDRLSLPYVQNPNLVRGLDYYVHTVWEITHTGLGAQDALAGGGRYRMSMGNRTLEGVGFAMGLERVIAALESQGGERAARPAPVWLVAQNETAFMENMVLMQTLRMRGVACGMDMQQRSIKAQMRLANRRHCRWVIIRGEQEMEKGLFVLKDMESGVQEELDMPNLLERFLSLQLTHADSRTTSSGAKTSTR